MRKECGLIEQLAPATTPVARSPCAARKALTAHIPVGTRKSMRVLEGTFKKTASSSQTRIADVRVNDADPPVAPWDSYPDNYFADAIRTSLVVRLIG